MKPSALRTMTAVKTRPASSLTGGETVRRSGRLLAMSLDISDGPRNGFTEPGARRPHPMGLERAAHHRRRAGDVEPDALAFCLGRNPAHRIGRGGIEKRHRREIDHE